MTEQNYPIRLWVHPEHFRKEKLNDHYVEIVFAHDYGQVFRERDAIMKQAEALAKTLEYFDGVHRLHWAINFNDLPGIALKALSTWEEFKKNYEKDAADE